MGYGVTACIDFQISEYEPGHRELLPTQTCIEGSSSSYQLGLSLSLITYSVHKIFTLYWFLGSNSLMSMDGRKRIIPVPKFSDPVITRSPVGIISIAELMSAALFIIFLTWTYYSRISNDFKKMTPNKSLHLNV